MKIQQVQMLTFLQNIIFCVAQNKEFHTGLKQHFLVWKHLDVYIQAFVGIWQKPLQFAPSWESFAHEDQSSVHNEGNCHLPLPLSLSLSLSLRL